MPTKFKYKAIDADGSTQSGLLTASDEKQVKEFLDERALLPISIQVSGENKPSPFSNIFKRTEYDKLIMFTNSLATMHSAGIPLLRALKIIRIGKEKGTFNSAIEQIRLELESGLQLSDAMGGCPDVFSRVYRACVKAGEESGKLDEILSELSEMLEREQELTRQIKSAVRYPVIVIIVIVLAFLVLMTFVVPQFVDFYSSFNTELPLPTRILIGTSNLVSGYWPFLLAASILLAIGFRKLLENPSGRLWFDRTLLSIPVVGELVLKGNVARFCLMFRILFKSGLPLVRSLKILTDTIRNVAICKDIERFEGLMRRGGEIGVDKDEFEYFPDQALHMIGVGLESGNLERMLGEVGEHYSKEVMYTSRQLTSIIEPFLTLVLGGFVLLLALAIFLPMWNLLKVFGQ